MALVTCYDPQGVEFQKEPVDARECVKYCGFSMTPPDGTPAALVTEADATDATAAKTNKK